MTTGMARLGAKSSRPMYRSHCRIANAIESLRCRRSLFDPSLRDGPASGIDRHAEAEHHDALVPLDSSSRASGRPERLRGRPPRVRIDQPPWPPFVSPAEPQRARMA